MMNPLSLLALQIALFHYYPGGEVSAFVQNQSVVATKRTTKYSNYQRYASSSSSSAFSNDVIELLPVKTPQQKEHQQRRHSIFQYTNAVSKEFPVPNVELWRKSLPSIDEYTDGDCNDDCNCSGRKGGSVWDILQNKKNQQQDPHYNEPVLLNDVHVEFDNPTIGARRLLEKSGIVHDTSNRNDKTILLPETIMAEEEIVQHLTSVLSYFQTIASSNDTTNVKCIARVVSTIGTLGTKCPRFHFDHVQVRLVMSILGPGCEYIQETFGNEYDSSNDIPRIVNRQAINNLDEEDTQKANDIIVPPELVSEAMHILKNKGRYDEEVIKHAEEGEAILLMGKGWEDNENDSINTCSSEDKVLAAVHRSPTLKPNQERILLTVDLVDWD